MPDLPWSQNNHSMRRRWMSLSLAITFALFVFYRWVPGGRDYFFAVLVHIFTLAAGCVATVMLGIIQRIRGKPLSPTWEIAVFLGFVFFAGFQAWQDEHKRSVAANQSPIANIQVTPTINVPPTTVVVQQLGQSTPPDLTAIMEVTKLEPGPPWNKVVEGGYLGFGIYCRNAGPQIAHDEYSAERMALIDPDEMTKQEPEARRKFDAFRKKGMRETLAKKLPGDEIGPGLDVMRAARIDNPLSKDDVEKIMNGKLLVYLFIWRTWKDSHNQVGTINLCYRLDPPQSTVLTPANTLWHTCTIAK